MKGNNLFGFKRNSRKFSVVTNAHGYLVYRDFHLSITDYACLERLLIAKYSLNTEEKYRAHIEKHYSQDATYGDKLKKALSLINFETA